VLPPVLVLVKKLPAAMQFVALVHDSPRRMPPVAFGAGLGVGVIDHPDAADAADGPNNSTSETATGPSATKRMPGRSDARVNKTATFHDGVRQGSRATAGGVARREASNNKATGAKAREETNPDASGARGYDGLGSLVHRKVGRVGFPSMRSRPESTAQGRVCC
jgi:hypothetical protein